MRSEAVDRREAVTEGAQEALELAGSQRHVRARWELSVEACSTLQTTASARGASPARL